MKVFNRVLASVASSVAAVGMLSGCTMSSPLLAASLPQISELTAEAGKLIAHNLSLQLAAIKEIPQEVSQSDGESSASVEIIQVSDVVIVEATRLPQKISTALLQI